MKSFFRSFIPPMVLSLGIAAMILVIGLVSNPPRPVPVAEFKEAKIEMLPEVTIYADPEPEAKPSVRKVQHRMVVSTTKTTEDEPTVDVGSARRRMPEHAVGSSSVRETSFYQKDGYHHNPAADVEFTETINP